MNGASPNIESRVADIERAVRALEARLDGVEGRSAVPAQRRHIAILPIDGSGSAEPARIDAIGALTLVGRTLVLLGGAYLLRALTESRALPAPVGLALGFAYAAAWLVVADGTAIAGRTLSAVFYGATTTIIALPLLFEGITRFAIVDRIVGAAMLAGILLAVLGVAVHRRLQALAWIVVCGAVVTSVAITAASGFVLPFAVVDIAIGVATLWIGYTVDWVCLRCVPALVADVAVLALAYAASTLPPVARPGQIVSVQLMLFAGYLASIGVRTLVRGREINTFEAVQGAAALAIGFGGAVYVAQATGSGDGLVVAIGLICGAAAYAVAFAFVARRQGVHRNYYFYTSIALILVLASTAAWDRSAALVWAALAVLVSWTARRAGHLALSWHGAIYVGAAAVGSGLVAAWPVAIGGAPAQTQSIGAMVAVFAAACACWAAPATASTRVLVRLPRLAVALIATASALAALVSAALMMSNDPGLIATARTAALVSAAVAAASVGRFPRFAEAGWLMYPLLVVGGMKLVLEDLPRSRPATLFIALAVYGTALIAAPRIAARRTS
jgi:hypothetical protein